MANHLDDLVSVLYTPVDAEVSDGVAEFLDPGKISALQFDRVAEDGARRENAYGDVQPVLNNTRWLAVFLYHGISPLRVFGCFSMSHLD